jgi:predicted nucleotidyltransferase
MGPMQEMICIDLDERARTAAVDFADRLVCLWHEELGTELLGVYLIGSLAHAGFSRRYSDVDMALVTAAGLSPQTLDRMRDEAAALSADWGPKLSLFWTDRHFSLGRFPPLDRVDYLDHAVVLMERERVRATRPTLAEIRDYLRGAPFVGWSARARDFAAAEKLEPKDHKAYLRTLLYPARFCYSWVTGLVGSNDDAVAFLQERRPPELDVGLIDDALECRRGAADPDALFPRRVILTRQIDACAPLIAD